MNIVFKNAHSLKETLPPGKTFTLLAGCFDILHISHIRLLERAKEFEDLLVIAILSDEKVQKNKGAGRPIQPEAQRAEIMSSIRFVDYVFIADIDPIGQETIELLKPSSVVFTDEKVVSERVKKWAANIQLWSPSTKIQMVPYDDTENISTSNIIKKIRA